MLNARVLLLKELIIWLQVTLTCRLTYLLYVCFVPLFSCIFSCIVLFLFRVPDDSKKVSCVVGYGIKYVADIQN